MDIKWSDDLKVGVEKIDRQHKELFARANNLLKAIEVKQNNAEQVREDVENTLYFLVDYIATHFSDEEKLQKEYDYPAYEEHKKFHQDFVENIEQIKVEFFTSNRTNLELVKNINTQVLSWLVNHIGNEDKKLASHIKEVKEK